MISHLLLKSDVFTNNQLGGIEMNKVILIGRLTQSPELTKTTTDKSVCRVTLAVNRRF